MFRIFNLNGKKLYVEGDLFHGDTILNAAVEVKIKGVLINHAHLTFTNEIDLMNYIVREVEEVNSEEIFGG